MTNSFMQLGITTNCITALNKMGITQPTDIQVKTIPLALDNLDLIGQSQTGSGKTLAYLLPLFHKILPEKKEMQAIILVPTHELAMQIHEQIKILATNSNISITSAPIIGGVNIKRQIDQLKERPHIIVGSTGRILELIEKKKITAHTIDTIVIDEGDRLLDKNNLAGVKAVIKTTKRERQLLLFSATINEKTFTIAKNLMKEPQLIKATDMDQINPNIDHIYFITEERTKVELLRKIIASVKPKKALIFINKSDDVARTTSKLQYHHIKAQSIYGTISKEERKKAINHFKTGEIQLLIASDLAARGLHIPGISHIINLDLPENPKEYLHRVGRTGRMGKSGIAISIVSPKELSLIKTYEKELKIQIAPKELSRGIILDKQISSAKKRVFTSDS